MKKTIATSIILAVTIVSQLNAYSIPIDSSGNATIKVPLEKNDLSVLNGGNKSVKEAISDGVGVKLLNQSFSSKVDNTPFNKLVFK